MNLFLELRRNNRLANKRHPMYEKSRFATFWIYLGVIFWGGYLILIGTLLALGLNDAAVEPYHILNSGLIFVLMIDFLLRLVFQKTPSQEVKPYILLPVRRNKLIDFLLICSGLNGFNFFWLLMFIPFAILSVAKFYGLWGVFTYCAGIWLLVLLNNYWYLLCRTLLSECIWWVFLPIAVYGGLLLGMFLPEDSPVFDWFRDLGEGFITSNALTFVGIAAGITLLWFIDRSVIRRIIYNELNKTEDTTAQVKTLSEYKFLDRYGRIGEYIRLELKMMLRNKICRNSLISTTCLVLFFAIIIGFTDIYNNRMSDFLVLYNYGIFALLFLNTLMSYEGNYIDGLMSRRESIYALLLAKYGIYSVALLIPFVLMLPGVLLGNIRLLQSVSWMIITAGMVYFGSFMICPYNNSTLNLNVKMSSRDMGTGMQHLMGFLNLAVPYIMFLLLTLLGGEYMARWVLIIIGVGFIATYRLWIRYVYNRFMQRRYKNMEGFRSSRQK